MAEGARTRNETAHAALRADIVSGRWHSGERLPFAELCNEYRVSVGVIREALVRLVEQGLVESRPQQGFFVVHTSPQDVLDIAEVRGEVESYAVRRAVEDGALEWESEVVAANYRLENTPLIDEETGHYSPAWVTAHADFHTIIFSDLVNRRLWTSTQQLRDLAKLYTHQLPAPRPEFTQTLVDDHRKLTDAILARDPQAAANLTREHIHRQALEIANSMANDPDARDTTPIGAA